MCILQCVLYISQCVMKFIEKTTAFFTVENESKLWCANKKKSLTIRMNNQGEKIITTWALTDSNRRPSACKADALNQLS